VSFRELVLEHACDVRGLPVVVVCDGSLLATGVGYGPTLTLVAPALRNAHALAGTTL
jgi:choline dehydrogenase-like flavoprotein